jgi:hypothetical protein
VPGDNGSKHFSNGVTGVKGSLNQGYDQDPYYGQRGPNIKEFSIFAPVGTDSQQLSQAINVFATNHAGSWSLLWNSCQTFQEVIINKFKLRLQPGK